MIYNSLASQTKLLTSTHQSVASFEEVSMSCNQGCTLDEIQSGEITLNSKTVKEIMSEMWGMVFSSREKNKENVNSDNNGSEDNPYLMLKMLVPHLSEKQLK